MKKIYFILTLLLTVTFGYAQELLVNGDLETWSTGDPTGWDKSESAVQVEALTDPGLVHGGASAARVSASSTRDLTQNITITPGENYTISFWYKVEVSDGADLRLWSYWLNGSSTVSDAATNSELRPSTYLSDTSWTQFTTTVTAPASGVDGYRFEIRTYSGSTVLYDDLSVIDNQTLSVNQNKVAEFSVFPNPVTNGTVNIKTSNNEAVQVSVFDVLGKQVLAKNVTNQTLNVSNLNAGMYILKLTQNGNSTTKKLVIN